MSDPRTTRPADTPPVGLSRGTNLASLGFVMAASGALLMAIATVAFGLDSGEAAFLAVPTVLGLAGAALVRLRRTAAKVVALVLAVVVAGTVFWTAFGLASPDSFLDFVPGVLVLPGVLLALAAGITSIRSARKARPVGAGERKVVTAVVVVLGLLAVVSALLTVTGRNTVPAAEAAEADLVVDMEDFEFDKPAYAADGETTVLIKNSDPFVHTFTVDALGIDVELGPLSEELVTLPDEAGTYILFCEPHTSDPDDPSDDDMAAELTIG